MFKKRPNFKLVYRGSDHGWTPSEFHACCDKKTETLVLMKTSKDYVCGAFVKVAWSSPEKQTTFTDESSILIQLTNGLKHFKTLLP